MYANIPFEYSFLRKGHVAVLGLRVQNHIELLMFPDCVDPDMEMKWPTSCKALGNGI